MIKLAKKIAVLETMRGLHEQPLTSDEIIDFERGVRVPGSYSGSKVLADQSNMSEVEKMEQVLDSEFESYNYSELRGK